jgi:hypothetical protein
MEGDLRWLLMTTARRLTVFLQNLQKLLKQIVSDIMNVMFEKNVTPCICAIQKRF